VEPGNAEVGRGLEARECREAGHDWEARVGGVEGGEGGEGGRPQRAPGWTASEDGRVTDEVGDHLVQHGDGAVAVSTPVHQQPPEVAAGP